MPAEPPSLVGTLLCVLGLGMAFIGLFALPLQDYRWSEDAPTRNIGFLQVRDLVDAPGSARSGLTFTSPLAALWWHSGMLLAASALIALTAAVCVARDPRFLRVFGVATAVVATASGVFFGLAMKQTADYRSMIYLRPSQSMYHDAGLGPWLGFAGLAALAIGGLVTFVLARPARQ